MTTSRTTVLAGLAAHNATLFHQIRRKTPGSGSIEGEVFTVEPGLYSATVGGVRVEDMVLVTRTGHEVLSPVPEGLNWKD